MIAFSIEYQKWFTSQNSISIEYNLQCSLSSKAMDHPHNKESDRFAKLDLDLRLKVQRIADVETLEWAQEYLSFKQNPTLYVSNKVNKDISRQIGSPDTVKTSDQMLRELRDYIKSDKETKKSLKVSLRKAQVSEKLHLAELISRFIKERDA
jgi:selenocysteine-specific translation elongation factor